MNWCIQSKKGNHIEVVDFRGNPATDKSFALNILSRRKIKFDKKLQTEVILKDEYVFCRIVTSDTDAAGRFGEAIFIAKREEFLQPGASDMFIMGLSGLSYEFKAEDIEALRLQLRSAFLHSRSAIPNRLGILIGICMIIAVIIVISLIKSC